MKPASKHKCFANMPAVIESNRAICVLAASVISESTLSRGNRGKLITPFTYGRIMRTFLVEQWFKYKLLKVLQKGRVIIMDNAAFHKKEVLHGIAKAHSQTLIFLPPHLPEHNPIEHVRSALKRNLASQVHRYSSVEEND